MAKGQKKSGARGQEAEGHEGHCGAVFLVGAVPLGSALAGEGTVEVSGISLKP